MLLLLAAGSATTVWADAVGIANCNSATLSSYISSSTFPSGGCAIGILDYYTFSYHAVSNAPGAADILVTPTSNGFSFTRADGAPFVAALGQIVQFEIDYNILIDPAPIINHSNLALDPPSGDVTVTEYFCNDSTYIYSGLCFGNTLERLTVGTLPPNSLTAGIDFANPAQRFQNVGILFTLNGTNGPSSFDGLDAGTTTVLVPEPAALASLLLGALALGGLKLKTRRNL